MRQVDSYTLIKPLLALGACLALFSVYLLFGKGQIEPKPAEPKSAAAPATTERAAGDASSDALLQAAETLAEFQAENSKDAASGETEKPPIDAIGRNLFSNSPAYRENIYEPVKTTPPPTKPSIELNSVIPDAVSARAKKLDLSIRGGKFARDMQIYINGSEATTDFISPDEVRTTLSAQMLASPQTLQIEVKRPASAAVFSNKLAFKVTPLPFAFAGQISDDGDNSRFVLSSGKDYFTVAAGEIFEQRWRVTGVSGDYLELEDVRLGSRHMLLSGEQPAQASKTEKASNQPVNQADSVNKQTEPTGLNDPNLFERKPNPMTYEELLKKRAEAARQKQRQR